MQWVYHYEPDIGYQEYEGKPHQLFVKMDTPIDVPNQQLIKMRRWCDESYNLHKVYYRCKWSQSEFFFEDEEDYIKFKLAFHD